MTTQPDTAGAIPVSAVVSVAEKTGGVDRTTRQQISDLLRDAAGVVEERGLYTPEQPLDDAVTIADAILAAATLTIDVSQPVIDGAFRQFNRIAGVDAESYGQYGAHGQTEYDATSCLRSAARSVIE